MPWSGMFNVANMSFNSIPENKIFVKISEFTVYGNDDIASKSCSDFSCD